MKQIRKRLTYANVMSSIAVFLILGGATAFAASKISAKQLQANSVTTAKIKKSAVTASKIKNNAITTGKIADKAVTGPKIDASTLGTVPNATNAANATNAKNAGNANTVGGQSITKVAFRTTSNTGTVGPTTVFQAGGLKIDVTCTSGSIAIVATSLATDSSVYTAAIDTDQNNVISTKELESGEFDTGETLDLLAGDGGNTDQIHFEFDAVNGFVADGIIQSDTDGGLEGCRATGHIISG